MVEGKAVIKMECCDTDQMKEMKEKMMSGNMMGDMFKCKDYLKEIAENSKAILEELQKQRKTK